MVRKLFILGGGAAALLVVGLLYSRGVIPAAGQGGSGDEHPEASGATETEMTATVVHPRMDQSLTLTVQQLASVEPLFEADLRAQVAGVVRVVPVSINDTVHRGDTLVELDVPDLAAEVQQKEAIIRQRVQEVRMADAQVGQARAFKEVAQRNAQVRGYEKDAAVETREFRKLQLARFVEAVREKGISKNFQDEEQRNYNAAIYNVYAADAAIHKAEAEVLEKESSLEVAQSDVELKRALADVARRDRDRAAALLGFAHVTAPFDGIIVERSVEPGMLVQNASSGRSEALLKVARTDVVTLVMKVPDNYAPYVSTGTEAVIHIDGIPDLRIRGKVTRFSPSILNKDRTMRVEVDLYNGPPESYGKVRTGYFATWLTPLGAATPLQAVTLSQTSRFVRSLDARSLNDPPPVRPEITDRTNAPLKSGATIHLTPGMSGTMRLDLQKFGTVPLIPASAVYTAGGNSYVLVVENIENNVGVTHRLPVRTLADDGSVARVQVIVKEGEPLRELRPDETIVLSRQMEIGPDQRIRVAAKKW